MPGSFIVIAGTEDNLAEAIAAVWSSLDAIAPGTRLQAIRDPWRHIIRHMLARRRTIRLGDHTVWIHDNKFFANPTVDCRRDYYRYEAGKLIYRLTTYAVEEVNVDRLQHLRQHRWSFLLTDDPTPIMVLAYLYMPIPL